jgi:hypothetical protein
MAAEVLCRANQSACEETRDAVSVYGAEASFMIDLHSLSSHSMYELIEFALLASSFPAVIKDLVYHKRRNAFSQRSRNICVDNAKSRK